MRPTHILTVLGAVQTTKIMIVHATYLTCIHTIYSPTLNSKYCLVVGVMLIREIVDICGYFFKLNQATACSSCTTFTELKYIIPLFPFLQHIKGLFKKRKENLGYLSK